MNGILYKKVELFFSPFSHLLASTFQWGISIFCCSAGNIHVVSFISSFDFSHKGLAYSIREKKKTNKNHVFLTAWRSHSCNCFCFCTCNKRGSRSLLGCVLLKRLGFKKSVWLLDLRWKAEVRNAAATPKHSMVALLCVCVGVGVCPCVCWSVCACIFVCRVSVWICFSTVSALLGPACQGICSLFSSGGHLL